MSFLAALLVLVHALLAGAFTGPTPAPHGVTVSPAAPAPASVVVRAGEARTPGHHPGARVPPAGRAPGWSSEGSSAPAAAPTVAAPAPDPAATQLPEEVIGRAVECPDGSGGYITDVELHTSCP